MRQLIMLKLGIDSFTGKPYEGLMSGAMDSITVYGNGWTQYGIMGGRRKFPSYQQAIKVLEGEGYKVYNPGGKS